MSAPADEPVWIPDEQDAIRWGTVKPESALVDRAGVFKLRIPMTARSTSTRPMTQPNGIGIHLARPAILIQPAKARHRDTSVRP